MAGNFQKPFLEFCLARLPCATAQLVENRIGPFRAIARQKLDILNRQKQAVIARIMDFKAVMRGACRSNRLEADKAPNAVIDMDDDIASRQRGDFRDEILIALAAPGAADEPVAQNILLRHDHQIARIEAAFDRQHRRRHLVARQGLDGGKPIDGLYFFKPVFVQNLTEPVERTFGPGGNQNLFAGGAQVCNMFHHGFKQVHVGCGALLGKAAALVHIGMNNGPAGNLRRAEWRKVNTQASGLGGFFNLARRKIEHFRLYRLVRHGIAARLFALRLPQSRFVMVHNHGVALGQRLMHQMVEHDRHWPGMVENCLHIVIEKRQPMFHASKTAAFADGLIKRIVTLRRAEHGHIILAKPAYHVGRERDFAHRLKHEFLSGAGGALGGGIEGTDRFQRIAEKIKPQRFFRSRRIKIENAAAYRIFADVAHGRDTLKAVALQPCGKIVHVELVAGAR
ncbi:Uncharacterised protein [Brucella melitensis]|nr:Uncharacterised protein [Brucella melitensis]